VAIPTKFRFLRRFGTTDARWRSVTPDLADYLEERDRELEDYLSNLGRTVGCSLQRAANQSIATAPNTTIQWDTESYDTDGYIAVTSGTVTIPAGLGGMYAITTKSVGAAGSASQLEIVAGGVGWAAPNTIFAITTLSVVIPLVAGHTIVVNQYHTAGVNVNYTGYLIVDRLHA
jgi:hypothetical protein